MTKDLVERLREYAGKYDEMPSEHKVYGTVGLLVEAAARIEELECVENNGFDECGHKVFDFSADVAGFTKTESLCPRCGNKLRAFYYESGLYGVRCDECPSVTLIKAGNPHIAAALVMNAKTDKGAASILPYRNYHALLAEPEDMTDEERQRLTRIKAIPQEVRGLVEKRIGALRRRVLDTEREMDTLGDFLNGNERTE